MSYPSKA